LKQTGKRKGLSSLPDTWQEQYWSWAKDSKYAHAIAVLDCCGCRPSELELGVDVTYRDGYLELYIQGTKRHGGKYGQAWRRVKVEPTFPAALHLVELCQRSETGSVNIQVESGKNLSATMAWYSKALWPDRRYVVTPYSYRHQFRAEAIEKLSTDEVAQAMGHSVDRTQNHYGTSRDTRGRQGGLGVEASRMPKHTRGRAPWLDQGYGGRDGPGL
jgi:integrase